MDDQQVRRLCRSREQTLSIDESNRGCGLEHTLMKVVVAAAALVELLSMVRV